jgi:hypothetical protein
VDEISGYYLASGGCCPTLEPDALLPIFIYCLVQSQHFGAWVDNRLVKEFMPRICQHSISGYYAVNLEAAIEYILGQ